MRKYVWGTMLAALLLVGCDRGSHPEQIGKVAPLFTVSDGQHTVDLAKLRGQVVVLNFWASWCAPCLLELPSMNAMQQQMPQVRVLGVSFDEDSRDTRCLCNITQQFSRRFWTRRSGLILCMERIGLLRRT